MKEKTVKLPKVGWGGKKKKETETGTQITGSARIERSDDLAKTPRVQRQGQTPLWAAGPPWTRPARAPGLQKAHAAPPGVPLAPRESPRPE